MDCANVSQAPLSATLGTVIELDHVGHEEEIGEGEAEEAHGCLSRVSSAGSTHWYPQRQETLSTLSINVVGDVIRAATHLTRWKARPSPHFGHDSCRLQTGGGTRGGTNGSRLMPPSSPYVRPTSPHV